MQAGSDGDSSEPDEPVSKPKHTGGKRTDKSIKKRKERGKEPREGVKPSKKRSHGDDHAGRRDRRSALSPQERRHALITAHLERLIATAALQKASPLAAPPWWLRPTAPAAAAALGRGRLTVPMGFGPRRLTVPEG